MKKVLTFIAAVFISINLFAQAPQKMTYQALIRNASNALVTNASVKMRISILQGSATGNTVYSELHSTTTNANGLVSIEIGAGTSPTGTFSAINWGNGTYFLKTETDPAGGTNYSIEGTSQLLSVPYALYAANAGNATNAGGFKHYIGEQFGGGVIFHLWKDVQGVEHGLIVALTDQSTGTTWSNITNTDIGAAAQSSWDGLANSSAIVAQPGHTSSAAKLCLDLVSGGQSDWYLPSIDQLERLYKNRIEVNTTLRSIQGATELNRFENNGNFISYWSSSEIIQYKFHAQLVNFGGGGGDSRIKTSNCYVRAIRAF